VAKVHGRNAQLYMGIASSSATAEPVAYLSEWSLDLSTPTVDATSFGEASSTFLVGLPAGSGSFSGFFDTATQQVFTAGALGFASKVYLYPTTPSTAGPYFYGTAFFSAQISAPVGDAVKISGNINAATPITRVG
jgi:hypothetical protein